jgi:hypothetical protein
MLLGQLEVTQGDRHAYNAVGKIQLWLEVRVLSCWGKG